MDASTSTSPPQFTKLMESISGRSRLFVYCRVYCKHCTLKCRCADCRPFCLMYTVESLKNVQYTVYTLQWLQYIILYSVHCTLVIVQFALYTVHCSLCTVYCTVYTLQCLQYVIQCIMYIIHSVFPTYPHKCGLTRICGYLGQNTRIIPAFPTKTRINCKNLVDYWF